MNNFAMEALVVLTALFGIAAVCLAWAATRIKPDFDRIVSGIPIYAGNETAAIVEANERSGLLNRVAALCTLVAVMCGFALGWLSLH